VLLPPRLPSLAAAREHRRPLLTASAFETLFPRPRGELGPPLVQATAEGMSATLHLEEPETLWIRLGDGEGSALGQIGRALVVVGRSDPAGPFFLAGSFRRFPPGVRRVAVAYDGAKQEASASEDGWLCLVPSDATGTVRIVWTDTQGRSYDTVEHPAIEEAAPIGPTFFVPANTPLRRLVAFFARVVRPKPRRYYKRPRDDDPFELGPD
jgi:hypothetical protein